MKTSVKRRAKNCIRGAVLLTCFIAVWYVASCFTQPLFIPAPATVWEAIVGLAETGQLQKGLAYSFLRITGASALSMLVAIPLSLLIYGVKPIKETIMPVVSFLRYVPVTAFSPLLILWFGIGEQMKISFLFIATFVYLLPSILLCFNDVPQDLMDTGKTIGMTSWETIKEILLPASLPSIFSTFLMMYGIGWTYCAVVEATNAKYGLGFIINVSSARGRTAVVFGAIIVIMAHGIRSRSTKRKIVSRLVMARNLSSSCRASSSSHVTKLLQSAGTWGHGTVRLKVETTVQATLLRFARSRS